MNNELTLIIIGLYTFVYVIVFLIQKSQIKATKEIISSMKSFMDIFKIDEVKKYVKLKEENVIMKHKSLFLNNEIVKKMVEDANNASFEQLKEMYLKQMRNEHLELVSIVIEVIRSQPKDKRRDFINSTLPKTKRYFLEMLVDIENNVI